MEGTQEYDINAVQGKFYVDYLNPYHIHGTYDNICLQPQPQPMPHGNLIYKMAQAMAEPGTPNWHVILDEKIGMSPSDLLHRLGLSLKTSLFAKS